MEQDIRDLINKTAEVREVAFKEGNSEVHRFLGRAMGNLIDADKFLKSKASTNA